MSADQVRLFVGTTVPHATATAVRNAAAHLLSLPAWRAAPEQQWHVTALFIGQRPLAQVDFIMRHVERLAASTACITLVNGKLTTMPKVSPSMLWVRFTPHPGITTLHHALARAVGAEPSIYVPYWPHITLARSRKQINALSGEQPAIASLTLMELSLFRSKPGPQGSVHETLATWPLV